MKNEKPSDSKSQFFPPNFLPGVEQKAREAAEQSCSPVLAWSREDLTGCFSLQSGADQLTVAIV